MQWSICVCWVVVCLPCVAAVEGGPFPLEPAAPEPSTEYGVLIDAGSTGSRVRVYTWTTQTHRNIVPQITEVFNKREKPGIASFWEDADGLEAYLGVLLSKAAENVPEEMQAQTRLYCMATAGMRLLLEERANDVIEAINNILMDADKNPFSYEAVNTRILSGEEEGVFGWITVNYLNGYFDRIIDTPDETSSGLLEMGGASLQIAFQPPGSILADKFPVKVGGRRYPLYVHSYLYYGQDYAHIWVQDYLYAEAEVKQNITHPCMFKEDTLTVDRADGEVVKYIGSGNTTACMDIMDVYVYDVDNERCQPKPCSMGTVYQPTIDDDMHFFAVSAFRFSLTSLKVLGEDGQLNVTNIYAPIDAHCSKSIFQLRNETGRDDPFQSAECLTSVYIQTLLTKAFRFSPNTDKISVVEKINGSPTDWTLGAIIYENERREWKCPLPKQTNGGPPMTSFPLAVIGGILLNLAVNM